MTEEVQLALSLLAVGMTTVFVMLLLVVYTGKLAIYISNRYAGIQDSVKERSIRTSQAPSGGISSSNIAAIAATVDYVTGGRGKIQSFEKKG